MRECVEHFVEGRRAWKIGVIGFFVRLRGVLITVVISIALMGTPWWWSISGGTKKIELKLGTLFIVAGVFVGVIAIIGFIYLRRRTRRSLEIQHLLHQIAHFLRDYQAKTCELILDDQRSQNELYEKERFCGYIKDICDHTKNYFRRLIGDSTIEVAIRLAVEAENEKREKRILYSTIGRSSGLNPDRSKTTEDIEANEGVARYLIGDKGSHGVLRYNDLQKAADKGTFKMTKNEIEYPDEICTMMVAPLKGWDGKNKSTMGILYVTSRQKKVFTEKHVDTIRSIADIIANAISSVIELLKVAGRMPDLKRGR